jgi:polyisoprenoid-binding protein YceI
MLGLSSGLTALSAQSATYNFQDPKGVNHIRFSLDAPLEAIGGTANGILGEVTFDPSDPAKTTGKIVVATASFTVPNPLMREHLLGPKWMDAAQHSELIFEANGIEELVQDGANWKGIAVGTLSVKGISKAMRVPLRLTHLPGKLADRSNGALKGDLLVLRAQMEILRSDFDINPGQAEDKVADVVSIDLAIAGASAH